MQAAADYFYRVVAGNEHAAGACGWFHQDVWAVAEEGGCGAYRDSAL